MGATVSVALGVVAAVLLLIYLGLTAFFFQ